MNKKISLLSLVVLIVAAIDNIRNFPAAALFGPSLIFFFALGALLFLIPTSLVAAELAALFPEGGGVYRWVESAFGKRFAMTAIWLQWINTMFWYPTILSFISGEIAYCITPELAESKLYLTMLSLALFWSLTLANFKGLYVSALINMVFFSLGTLLPMLLIFAFGAFWVVSGQPLQIELTAAQVIPSLHHTESYLSLIAVMASFLGIELSGVHINEVDNPRKNFPKATLFAVVFIFFSMVLGSLTIAAIVPKDEINLITGVQQMFHHFLTMFGLERFSSAIALLIAVGSTGTMINWLISPAKGLLQAASLGFLPPLFCRTNEGKVPHNILLAQAAVVSLILCVFSFDSSLNGIYWFLTALSTELYMIMYLLMFFAALAHRMRSPVREGLFMIPGKLPGLFLTLFLGILGCLLTIGVSFFPPSAIQIEHPQFYLWAIVAGNIVALSPLGLFFLYEIRSRKKSTAIT